MWNMLKTIIQYLNKKTFKIARVCSVSVIPRGGGGLREIPAHYLRLMRLETESDGGQRLDFCRIISFN